MFDPKMLERLTFEDFNELTKEQLADKIIHHTIKLKGVDFLVWSKYDEHGELLQRAMVRKSVVDEAEDKEPLTNPTKRSA